MKMKKRFLSILLSLVMVLGLMPGMSLTAYAEGTVHTALQQGDVIKLGDSINITTGNNQKYGYCLEYNGIYAYKLAINKMPWTLVRGDIGFDNYSYVENSNGDYYLFKGADGTMMPFSSNLIKVTNASDGIYYQSNSYGYPVVAIHIPPHTHDFTYSADGATITAKCGTEGCTLTNSQATLTIEKPTLTTYGETGKSAAATLTGLEAFNAATSLNVAATDIKYVGRDGTTYAESATAPTNAGKYIAKITVEGQTASVDYEIDKAQPTTPTGLTAKYGQTLANVTLPAGWTWADSTQSVGDIVSPAASFKANFAGDDNYNAVSNVDVTVNVGIADNPMTYAETQTVTKTFSTAAQTATLEAAKEAQGELSYGITSQKKGEDTVNYFTLDGTTLTLAANTPVGTYTVVVYARAAGNGNYFSVIKESTVTVTVTIAKIVYTAVKTSATVDEHTIGSGEDAVLVFQRSVEDEKTITHFTSAAVDGKTLSAGDYSIKSGSLILTLKASYLDTLTPGTHQVTATFDDGSADTTITILEAPPTAAPTNVPKTGDGADLGLWLTLMLAGLLLLGGWAVYTLRKRN